MAAGQVVPKGELSCLSLFGCIACQVRRLSGTSAVGQVKRPIPNSVEACNLHFYVHDLFYHQCPEQLQEQCDGQHLFAHRIGEQDHDIIGIELIHGGEQ